jgi:hypothetical protein
MAWNRRISASGTFFDLMRAAGFLCHHHGQCIYSFYLERGALTDPYLCDLPQHVHNERQAPRAEGGATEATDESANP